MNTKTKKSSLVSCFHLFNIHLRGKILTPPLLSNNHKHITDYPIGAV